MGSVDSNTDCRFSPRPAFETYASDHGVCWYGIAKWVAIVVRLAVWFQILVSLVRRRMLWTCPTSTGRWVPTEWMRGPQLQDAGRGGCQMLGTLPTLTGVCGHGIYENNGTALMRGQSLGQWPQARRSLGNRRRRHDNQEPIDETQSIEDAAARLQPRRCSSINAIQAVDGAGVPPDDRSVLPTANSGWT